MQQQWGNPGVTLYHGSNIEIARIDLSKCRPYKDFGRGFYTTPFEEQAWAMARRTARLYRGTPCITLFDTDKGILDDTSFKTRAFDTPCIEWALFVINNRNRAFADAANPECNIDNKYDMVSGPVANDDLVALLNLYIAGTISNAALTAEMTFRKMTSQISFHTERIIAHLTKTGAKYG
ncbi:MAG: DUF3990 domain-containing protein [Treponema sp.]|jgi:hypothetical protein|nr:DUF3990 domain-containing protein [Treponema sp.]